jgi:hypothetical protein
MQFDANVREAIAKRRCWLILSIGSTVLAPCAFFAFGISQYWSALFWLFCVLWSVTFVVGVFSCVRLLILPKPGSQLSHPARRCYTSCFLPLSFRRQRHSATFHPAIANECS